MPSQSLHLKQMSYLCPGLHGPDSRQNIQRKTFGDFLTEMSDSKTGSRLIIPLFQRRYCWDETRVRGWVRDVFCGKRDLFGAHNCGKIVMKEFEGDFLVIDGQQRLTTESLLLAAIRDKALDLENSEELIEKLESILYCSGRRPENVTFYKNGIDSAFSIVAPSLCDRQSYFQCITEGLSGVKVENDTRQSKAKRIFEQEIELKIRKEGNGRTRLRALESITDLALRKMAFHLIDIQNDINLTQVFLWLQEKTLFSEGALVFNPNPGVDFTCGDLVRNLMLASVMNKNIDEQENFHKHMWLNRVESAFPSGDTEAFGLALSKFVSMKNPKHISSLEEMCVQFRKKFSRGVGSHVDHIMTYAKFYSLYEQMLRERKMLPPTCAKRLPTHKEEKELEFSNSEVEAVSLHLLEELHDFVGTWNYKT